MDGETLTLELGDWTTHAQFLEEPPSINVNSDEDLSPVAPPYAIALEIQLDKDGYYVQWPVRPEDPRFCPKCARQPAIGELNATALRFDVECLQGHTWAFPYRALSKYPPSRWPKVVKVIRENSRS